MADVRFGSKADIGAYLRDGRFTPKSGHACLFDYLIGCHEESFWHYQAKIFRSFAI
jgi:hypothetical protein